jgi:acylphosphatase
MKEKRLKALFSGTVHGVGFRFTAERLARHFAVTGYVRNLPNGKVEIVAEGEEAVVKDFLKAVESAMDAYIRHVDSQWSEPEGTFADFGIAY